MTRAIEQFEAYSARLRECGYMQAQGLSGGKLSFGPEGTVSTRVERYVHPSTGHEVVLCVWGGSPNCAQCDVYANSGSNRVCDAMSLIGPPSLQDYVRDMIATTKHGAVSADVVRWWRNLGRMLADLCNDDSGCGDEDFSGLTLGRACRQITDALRAHRGEGK